MMGIEYKIHWLGVIGAILAIFAGISLLTWTSNTYGNQLAKQCIAKQGNWVLTDRQYSKYECQFKEK